MGTYVNRLVSKYNLALEKWIFLQIFTLYALDFQIAKWEMYFYPMNE